MSPLHLRYILGGFGLLIAGVTANVMLLQPSLPSGVSARAVVDANKAERERRQRLALDPVPAAPAVIASAAIGNGASERQQPVAARVQPTSPLPGAASIPMEQGPRRFARLRPDAAQANRPGDKLPEAPDAEGDPETIKAVQRELNLRNYGPLTSDGVPGLVTRAAIMAFEHDHRMALTGEATERVLQRLLLGASGAPNEAVDPAAGRVRSPQAELVMRTVQQSLAALGYQVGRIDGKTGEDIARAIREFELDSGLKPTGRVSSEVFGRLGRVVAAAKPKPIQ
jgi:peptidoglycan hydrolase-like protein with peptidoglycan-binding domain